MRQPHHIPLADVRVSFAEEDGINPSLLVCVEGCGADCVFCNRPGLGAGGWGLGVEKEKGPRRPLCGGRSAPDPSFPAPLQKLDQLARTFGAVALQLTGGEPLMYSEAFVELLAGQAEERGKTSRTSAPSPTTIEQSRPRAKTRGPSTVPRLPIVLNTGLLVPRESVLAVIPLVDRIIAGAKFGSPSCAARLSRVPDACDLYWDNLAAVRKAGVPCSLRFLIIPGHLDCCLKPLLERAAKEAPGVPVTLLSGYMPPVACPQAPEILRLLTREEVLRASGIAEAAGVAYKRSAGAVARLGTADGTRCGRRAIGSPDKIGWTGNHHRPSMLAAHSPDHAGGAPTEDPRSTRPLGRHRRWPEMADQGLELIIDAEGRICFSTYGPAAIELTARAFGRTEDETP